MTTKNLWKALLQLAAAIKDYPHRFKSCTLCFKNGTWMILFDQYPEDDWERSFLIGFEKEDLKLVPNCTIVQIKNHIEAKLIQVANCPSDDIDLLLKYVPYCFLSVQAKAKNRAVSIAHFAQSLDGKIATHAGDSKWIGNEENLIHAHRMRALCDAILIGKATLSADQPSLTVRKVEGKNPRKVVLGSPHSNYDCLLKADQEAQILLIGKQASRINGQVQYFQLESENGTIDGLDILELLYEQGLHSVYIEGGAKTTSNFLKDQSIDILQLHISPIVFGSGIQGVVLPLIDEVKESIQFQYHQFQTIGDSVMFVGRLKIRHTL